MSKSIQISILSENSKTLEEAIAAGAFQDLEGCEITVAGKNRGLGFGSSSEILMLALGIVGGIPAGVIANAIYDKIKGGREAGTSRRTDGFTVMIDGEAAKDLEGFEVLLKRKMEE